MEATAHTAEIIAFLDYASGEAWESQPWHKRGDDYDRLNHRVAEGLLDFVDRHYPGFKTLVDYCEVSTPLSVEHFTGHRRGSVYRIPATPERFRLPYLSVATPVRNLYLTGADVCLARDHGRDDGRCRHDGSLAGESGILSDCGCFEEVRGAVPAVNRRVSRSHDRINGIDQENECFRRSAASAGGASRGMPLNEKAIVIGL